MSSGPEDSHNDPLRFGSRRSRILAGLGLVLLILIMLAYYIYHKPVSPQLVANLVGLVIDLLAASVVIGVSTAIGSVLLERWRVPESLPLSAATVIGLGVMAVVWLILGFAGFLRAPVALIGTLGLVVALRVRILEVLYRAIDAVRGLTPERPFEWLVALGVVGLAGLALLEAGGPPVKYDALVYHLALPREWVRTGSLLTGVDNPYWGQPIMAELNFTWARLITGRASAMTVTGWLVAVLALSTTQRTTQRLLGGAGWVAVAALMAGATVWSSLGWGYVDWWAALAGAAALPVILDLYALPDSRTAGLAGLLVGLAISIKLTAAVLLGSAGVVLLVLHRSRKGLLAGFRMAAAAALAYSPWLLKNLFAADQPFYPFLGRSGRISPYQQALYGSGGDATLWDALLTPVRATLIGVEGAPGFAASIGPLLLGFTVALFLGWRRLNPRVRWLAGTLLAWWVIWGTAAALRPLLIQSRLYFVMFPAWAAAAGGSYLFLSGTRLGQVRLKVLANAIILTVFTLAGLQALTQTAGNLTLGRVLGMVSESEYLDHRLGASFPAMMAARDLSDRPGSVLMLWEPRSFYCLPVCIPDPWIARWYSDRRELGSVDQILAAWEQNGIEFVVTHDDGIRFIRGADHRYSASDWDALAELQSRLDPIGTIGSSYSLYRMP